MAKNTVNILTFGLDPQGRIVAFNKACEEISGYSFEEVRGRYIWERFLIPQEVAPFQAVWEHLKSGDSPEYNCETYWVTKNGDRRRIAWSNSVLLNSENNVEYIIGSGIDITESELQAEQLNQQHQRMQVVGKITLEIRQSLQLEEILETTVTEVLNLLQADRVSIYRLWPDGTGSAVKEAVSPGWPSILGQTFEPEVFPQEYHQLYASGRVRVIENTQTADLAPCLVDFLQQFGVKAKLVVPILLKEELWGLLVAHQCSSPRQWSSFEIELLEQLADHIGIALAQAQDREHLEELVAERTAKLTTTLEKLQQEIAERQRTENALRESQERWRSLVKNAPDIIYTCDPQGKLLFINRTVPGITVEQSIGTSIYEYIAPQYQHIVRQSLARVFQTGEPAYYEIVGVGANGTKAWYASRAGALQHNGRVVAAIAISTDITERKRTEETLRSLYKVSTARKLSFERRLQGLLALGRRQFGLEMAALGRVASDRYEVVAAQMPPKLDFPLTKGTIWNLAQTYCSITLGAPEPIAFESAGTSHWCRLPAYTASRLESYIGMPVMVAGSVYGTLSFFSLQVRQHPFTAGDKELLKLMAQWVGAALERQHTEEELRQSEAKFRQLAQREALLNQLASQIRRSLDINTILETAVREIHNLLQIDRCFFLWYRPDATEPFWEVVQEAKIASFPSLMGYCVPVTVFGPLTTRVFNKEITRVDSARMLTDPTEQKFFFSIGYTALLALPIHTTSGEIGVVSCGHSSGPRPWHDEEVELLQRVADQIAIAIDQGQLYKQSRTAAATAREQAAKLEQALDELQQTQAQLVQSEKMSSLGQLVAGVAHEINNPINFIYGNLIHINNYAEELLNLIQLYQEYYPQPAAEIQALEADIDLDFIKEDLSKILSSMKIGADRISQIVLSLRNFARLDEAEMKWVDIHEGLDNTLLILSHRLKGKDPGTPAIQVIKDYGNLPKVQCYPGQLNQVFMNILTNAIDAIEENPKTQTSADVSLTSADTHDRSNIILIGTEVLADSNQVVILIGDNGLGMTQEVQQRMCDPFFTTKPVGKGTGLGMSISYQIVVERHKGKLQCISAPGYGTVFLIYIPIH
ncbi:MAG TPA: PAS domain S-box protein [Cyanobacteria bacterium UBA8803]|nr:PAS domain S-box protein [Cyanobacteria bacterium UBA9273]HBL62166.1 PAS domain S-box protein [Cyanobacteria bacterium UBA8803]